jgi:hypothetical protein
VTDLAHEDQEGDPSEGGAHEEGEWVLVASVPPSNPQSSMEIVGGRVLAGDEVKKAREANAFLFRLANAHSYGRLVDLYQQFEAARTMKASARRKALEMNRAATTLARVASSYGDELLEPARADFEPDRDEFNALEAAIAKEADQLAFKLLVGLAEVGDGPFGTDGDKVINAPDAIEALRASFPKVGPDTNFRGVVIDALLLAQRMLGHLLNAYSDRIDAASLTIRLLAAEVLEGAPGLAFVRSAPDGKMQMTPEPLNLDSAAVLVHARRMARHLLEVTSLGGQPAEPDIEASEEEQGESERGAGVPGAVGAAGPASIPDNDAVAQEGETGEAAVGEGDTGEAPPPEVEGTAADQVLDLVALAEHATQLTQLERAWSEALDDEKLVLARREMEAKFSSLLAVFQRYVTASDASLSQAGFDTIIPQYPLPDDEVEALTLQPDAERRLRQLRIAQIDALIALLKTLELMRQPSGAEVNLVTGTADTWWEAGSFLLVREQLELLVRLTEEADAARAALLSEPEPDQTRRVFERLMLGGKALMHGDIEAGFMHAALALHARAGLAGDVPPDLIERLAADERLGPQRVVLSRLREALVTIGAGQPVDLGASQVIIPRLLQLVAHICLEAPQSIIDAVGETPSDA